MGKRNRHQKQSAMPGLIHKIQTESQLNKNQFTPSSPADPRISEMLQEVIAPFKHETTNFSDYRKLITLGVLAWNIANSPMEEMLDSLNRFLNSFPLLQATAREDIRETILELVRRKIKLFPDIQRAITNFEITESKKEFQITVSTNPE